METMDIVATTTVNRLYMNRKQTSIMQSSVQIDVEIVAGIIESSCLKRKMFEILEFLEWF